MKLSLITACWNSEATIGRTLQSVLSQVGEYGLEHVIQDGGSTDSTLGMIEDYSQGTISGVVSGEVGGLSGEVGVVSGEVGCEANALPTKPHISVSAKSEKDAGFYDAINKAVARSTGDIVGLINADDWLADDRVLADVVKLFEADPELDAVYADLDYVVVDGLSLLVPSSEFFVEGGGDGHGSPVPSAEDIARKGDSRPKPQAQRTKNSALSSTKHKAPSTKNSALSSTKHQELGTRAPVFEHRVRRHWVSGNYTLSSFRNGWMPPHPTVYVRRRVYERFGAYRLDMGTAADYEWMLRVFVKEGIKAAYLPRVSVKMLMGGISNESVFARLKANKNDRKAWEVNGLKPYPWFGMAKPLRKIGQYFSK